MTLVFVAVLLAAFALDVWIFRPWELKHRPRAAGDIDTTLEFTVPRNLFFHPGHTWVRLDEDGQLTVGVDDLARTVIGDLSGVELPAVGARLEAGLPALGIRQGIRVLHLPAPVSGVVTEVNAGLGRDPVRLRWRPYKEGWGFRVAPVDGLSAELAGLAVGRNAERWMTEEIDRLGALFERGILSPPVAGALQRAGDDAWTMFEREMLRIESGSCEAQT